MLKSCLCTEAQLRSELFRRWAVRMRWAYRLHRKLWAWCYIAQALHERGFLRPGRRGLGFAVGREPLVALFASFGCEIVATDLGTDRPGHGRWAASKQHATGPEVLNEAGICEPDEFRRRVSFRFVDMNAIPRNLRGFDFAWSSCALEHLGSLRRGKRFLYQSTHCLAPHGVGVHTTEFNLSSNLFTLNYCRDVLFRRRDIEAMARVLATRGYHLDLDFDPGNGEADRYVDYRHYTPAPGPLRVSTHRAAGPATDDPFHTHPPQLKLGIGRFIKFVCTSIGLIVENPLQRAQAA
jgi:hypothetical protein